ncbi:MAG: hypothetical protein D6800_12295, partial [Candidatus Zixiibacteriota bacterium]
MESTARTGPSIGKIILIVILVIILLLVIGVVLIRTVFREDVMRATVKTAINVTEGQVRTNPPEGVDTTRYLALCEAFLKQIEAAPLNDTAVSELFYTFRDASQDKTLDSQELATLEDLMISNYPELESYRTLTASPEEEVNTGQSVSRETIVVNVCEQDPKNAADWRNSGISLFNDPEAPTKRKVGKIPACESITVEVLQKKTVDGVMFYK